MKVRGFVLISLLPLVAATILAQSQGPPTNKNVLTAEQARPVLAKTPEGDRGQVLVAYGKGPLSFETNQGQTGLEVRQ
jgi:hypothetical protein